MLYLKKFLMILLAVSSLVLIAGCDDDSQPAQGDEPVIIEPGLSQDEQNEDGNTHGQQEGEFAFTDKGEKTTVEDLALAQSNIKSYYFEQTIHYSESSVFLRVWYCDNKMKVITSADGSLQSVFYYDYDQLTQITYSPADNDIAIGMVFDPASVDAPDNPLDDDYLQCTLLGSEIIDRQLCYIMQTAEGDKLWVSTLYGFPLQVEFVDHLGDNYTVAYRNIEINTITADQVEFPDDLQVEFLK